MDDPQSSRMRSSAPHFNTLVAQVDARRRGLIKAALSAGVVQLLGLPGSLSVASAQTPSFEGEPAGAGSHGAAAGAAAQSVAAPVSLGFASLAFAPVADDPRARPGSAGDRVRVPAGYSVQVLIAHGDPLLSDAPRWKGDASESARDQALQFGSHNDGMWFFPLQPGDSTHGLLCVNHEYVDPGLLFADGQRTWSGEKVKKALAAHGVSVLEVQRDASGRWDVVPESRYTRRITGETPCAIAGPAAGHPLMRTAADPRGTTVLGTLGNCACGATPWGTYLTCEENFNGYFGSQQPFQANALEKAIGFRANGYGHRWHEHEPRFDLSANQVDAGSTDAARNRNNEPNRFGWVVEIDPRDPQRAPVKRTALGRFKHECAAHALAPDGRVVVYMQDDEQFEYIYKWVSAKRYKPGDETANGTLLDEGTLYVARFSAEAGAQYAGRGEWLELSMRVAALRERFGGDLAHMLIDARSAADLVGATPMDRPEWIAVHPRTGEVYCSLTNNTARGQADKAGADAANPRTGNHYGQIVRWREAAGDAAATQFEWDLFVLAGDVDLPESAPHTVRGDSFGSPDGLCFDRDGRLWIQTDISTHTIGIGPYVNMPNNALLAADPLTREVRRFLTGPYGCEITGTLLTPDGRSMFVGIQHPGEAPREVSDASVPEQISKWPACQGHGPAGRPRSAVVVVTRDDGGRIGA